METLRGVVVLIHLVGFAVLFGAWAVEAIGRRRITRLQNWGLLIAGVAGIALAAPWGITWELNYVKLGVKLAVLLAIGALLGIGSARQRKSGAVPAPLFWGVGILTITNAALAVLWR